MYGAIVVILVEMSELYTAYQSR